MSSHFFFLVVISLPFVAPTVPPVSFEENELEYHGRQKRDTSSLEERESCQPYSTQSATRSNTTGQLWKLRQKMRDNNYSAYIIPTNDEHQSEYVANYDKRRQYISGFTGSAGIAVVLLDVAALWTDGRYFLQAEDELDCNWILMKENEKNTPKISEWLIDNLSNGSKVGADPRLISQKWWLETEEELKKSNIILVGEYKNLIDEIWTEADGRDPEPTGKIFIRDITYAGKDWNTKIEELIKELEDKNADSMILTALDEVAWLFNLRGSDVPHCPVFKSFAFVSQDEIRLYIDPVKLTDEVIHHLTENGNNSYLVQLKNYSDVYNDVSKLITNFSKILISSKSSYAFYNLIPEEKRIVSDSPVVLMKAVKNPTEIEGMKKANIKDSVAIIDFIAMLEEEVKAGKYWDEIKASETLAELRKQQELNMGESFEAISASGPNGAVIHYSPQPATNRVIDTKDMYLLDTGGQYLDGTTDTTRTFHFGLPNDYEKETYTRVLMGVIDLASAVFPEGVRDVDIDIFARRHLYEIGLNYLHGTGHGIGSFLNVHEGPTRVREARSTSTKSKLEPGMFFSDEPGFYENGKFGIRLETVLTVVKADTQYNFNNETYYKFEPVAFVPFEPKLIKLNLLDKYQIKWLNDYNLKIRQIIGEELHSQNKLRAYDWMMSRTTYIETLTCNS